MRYLFFVLVFLVLFSGCVTMREIKEEASLVSPSDVTAISEPVSMLLDNALDDPLRSFASGSIGYLLCLLRNLYKRKKREGSAING